MQPANMDGCMIRFIVVNAVSLRGTVVRGFPAAAMLLALTFTSFASYLTAKGSKLYNDKGEAVCLTGVNWFGFETTNMFPHGLWVRDYHGVRMTMEVEVLPILHT